MSLGDYRTITVEQRDGYAELVLNRPEALNAINQSMAEELCEALGRLGRSAEVRAVLLRGAGRAFSAGGDVKDMQATLDSNPAEFFDEPLRKIHGAALALAELPRPVVCAVQGFASGAAFNLALGADFLLCSADARFNQAFVRLGLVPDCGGTYYLPRRIGAANALELFLTGDFIDAQRALALGLVHRVLPAESLTDDARAFTARLAQGPTRAYAEIKALVRASTVATLPATLDAERAAQVRLAATDDFKEGVRALLQRRQPGFTGR